MNSSSQSASAKHKIATKAEVSGILHDANSLPGVVFVEQDFSILSTGTNAVETRKPESILAGIPCYLNAIEDGIRLIGFCVKIGDQGAIGIARLSVEYSASLTQHK